MLLTRWQFGKKKLFDLTAPRAKNDELSGLGPGKTSMDRGKEEEAEEEGGRAVELNLLNCLKEAISPVVGDIACQQNHV